MDIDVRVRGEGGQVGGQEKSYHPTPGIGPTRFLFHVIFIYEVRVLVHCNNTVLVH